MENHRKDRKENQGAQQLGSVKMASLGIENACFLFSTLPVLILSYLCCWQRCSVIDFRRPPIQSIHSVQANYCKTVSHRPNHGPISRVDCFG